uniref:Alanyl-tRNA synthetase class IIc N-terminal domain-containing protein n=1 Tax=Fagus sylvatica TaxID=28930 RepID=A0A2N9EPT1_FAGSY
MAQVVEWPANRVRETFINFFEEKKHVDWKSSPVVPVNDPTLLFANTGTYLLFGSLEFLNWILDS